MIRVTVELLPGGYDNITRRTIAMMHVGNMSNLAPRSDYDVMLMEAANSLASTPSRTAAWTLRDHDRHQSVWMLIRAALAEYEGADFEEL
ncbi:hypothetical protein E0H22_15635 [Rhodopseudomonas boonkerdii]|uniref:hypothetical protein n=1 Tax=Rhodopseudomonas boonkerdii TaxID=475937 RepID=UPI001E56246C|nr:hypothetical protein [Rhodopseudomonas boonkerdii]UGV26994.1 hypothetical protein E0H22_15635 [Rhodopseudomonas boonkerdii]